MTPTFTFKEYPKTPRLKRDMLVTEKIDGTNAAVIIMPQEPGDGTEIGQIVGTLKLDQGPVVALTVEDDKGQVFYVGAQSRKRVIYPGKTSDNAGFARWVRDNAAKLASILGPGYHYGEWFGAAIQGNPHGLEGKEFRLFNVIRYAGVEDQQVGDVTVGIVPVLYDGPFSVPEIDSLVIDLRDNGSKIPGREGTKAEGVVVFHKASGNVYKVLCTNDDLPKGVTTRQEREIAGTQ